MLRRLAIVMVIGSLGACTGAKSSPNDVPVYEGRVETFDKPIVVTSKPFPKTPTRFFQNKRLSASYKYQPGISEISGSLEGIGRPGEVTLIAKIPTSNSPDGERIFEVPLDEMGYPTHRPNGIETTTGMAAFEDLTLAAFSIPLLEEGFMPRHYYAKGANGEMLLSFVLRGKTTFKGRPALVFDLRGRFGHPDPKFAIIQAGYRILDIETGAVLYSEMLKTRFQSVTVHHIVEMDTSKWPSPANR